MSRFIATMIERAADVSLEKGQEKYRAYFIKTSLYTPYKADASVNYPPPQRGFFLFLEFTYK